jgi:hypothetical protein
MSSSSRGLPSLKYTGIRPTISTATSNKLDQRPLQSMDQPNHIYDSQSFTTNPPSMTNSSSDMSQQSSLDNITTGVTVRPDDINLWTDYPWYEQPLSPGISSHSLAQSTHCFNPNIINFSEPSSGLLTNDWAWDTSCANPEGAFDLHMEPQWDQMMEMPVEPVQSPPQSYTELLFAQPTSELQVNLTGPRQALRRWVQQAASHGGRQHPHAFYGSRSFQSGGCDHSNRLAFDPLPPFLPELPPIVTLPKWSSIKAPLELITTVDPRYLQCGPVNIIYPEPSALQRYQMKYTDITTLTSTPAIIENQRLLGAAGTILETLKTRPVSSKRAKRYENYVSRPDFKALALSQLTVVEDCQQCSFCASADCSWGVYDERLLLPPSASTNTCTSCFETRIRPSEGFISTLQDMIPYAEADALDHKIDAAVVILREECRKEILVKGLKQPLFCKACPWRQVDVTKAKICRPCRSAKVMVLKHHKHQMIDNYRVEMTSGMGLHTRVGCMVCLGLATSGCGTCPLKLCTTCESEMRSLCKYPVRSKASVTKRLTMDRQEST